MYIIEKLASLLETYLNHIIIEFADVNENEILNNVGRKTTYTFRTVIIMLKPRPTSNDFPWACRLATISCIYVRLVPYMDSLYDSLDDIPTIT